MGIPIRFEQHHVFVFGGTTGINLGIADAFAAQGANVTVASRNPKNVDNAVEHLRRHGSSVEGVCVDVRDFEACGKVIAQATNADREPLVYVKGEFTVPKRQ